MNKIPFKRTFARLIPLIIILYSSNFELQRTYSNSLWQIPQYYSWEGFLKETSRVSRAARSDAIVSVMKFQQEKHGCRTATFCHGANVFWRNYQLLKNSTSLSKKCLTLVQYRATLATVIVITNIIRCQRGKFNALKVPLKRNNGRSGLHARARARTLRFAVSFEWENGISNEALRGTPKYFGLSVLQQSNARLTAFIR